MTIKICRFLFSFCAMSLVAATHAAAQSDNYAAVLAAIQGKKIDQAVQLSTDYCEAGDAAVCHLSGVLHSDPQYGINDYRFARLQFDMGCEGDYMPSCVPLAQMQYKGLGGAVDKKAAYEKARKACGAGDAQACAAAETIKPEISTPIPVPQTGPADTPPFQLSDVVPLLDQMSDKLKETCGTSGIASADDAKGVLDACTNFTAQFPRTAFDMDETLPELEKAVLNFAAAWAITAKVQMFLDLYAMNRLPADPMAVQCSGYDTAEFFMEKSQVLATSELSLRYLTVESQILAGQAICQTL